MKKIIVLLICLQFFVMPSYCMITDDFVEETLKDSEKTIPHKQVIINDEFAENNNTKNVKSGKVIKIEENLPQKILNETQKKVVVFDETDMIPIAVRIKNYYTTKSQKRLQEGDYIEFETINDVTLNKKIYPSGTTVFARIETISPNKAMGVPADVVVGNFNINNILLNGEINKTGANRTLWVYPAMLSTAWFFGAGLVFAFVRGGHAKIKKSEIFTLYAKK